MAGIGDIEILKNIAVELAHEELTKLSYRERIVLEAIARGCIAWSDARGT